MNRAAVYVFRDAVCKEYGFTMFSRHFENKVDADAYAKAAGHRFFRVVDFDDRDHRAAMKNQGRADARDE
jgi:hypothetical protein